ncbi:MAG: hypothetical protein WC928_02200 [Patescibacteria group bacterium]|jgi:hypothetical protein
MLSYRAILKQALRISWKNKLLWFFGFFASLISFTAEFKIITQSLNRNMGVSSINNIKTFINTGIFSKNAWTNIVELIKNDPKSILFLIFVLLIIMAVVAFFAWLSTVSQISIIDSVNKIMKGKIEKLTIKKSIQTGNKKFWPVFLLNVFISLVVWISHLIIGTLLLLAIVKNQALTVLLYGLIFIIFIPLSLFISFVIKYAIAYSIIEGKKMGQAIKQGWKLFLKNWLISVEMSIILFFVNIITLILLSIISFIGFFLFFGLALSTVFLIPSSIFFWIIIILGGLFLLAVMVLGGALLNVFQITSWTDLFVQLRGDQNIGKLEKIFQTQK